MYREWQGANLKTEALYGFSIDGAPVVYSNQGLHFWEGAAVWTGGDKPPRLQLKRGFQKGKWGIYSRDEVLAHEAVHLARMCFDEPRFEELLAYRVSESRFRRYWGPLFRRPSEVWFFLGALVIGFWGTLFLHGAFWGVPLIPVLFCGVKLVRDQRCLERCIEKVGPKVAICLKDEEIEAVAGLETVAAYLSDDGTLRRRLLCKINAETPRRNFTLSF